MDLRPRSLAGDTLERNPHRSRVPVPVLSGFPPPVRHQPPPAPVVCHPIERLIVCALIQRWQTSFGRWADYRQRLRGRIFAAAAWSTLAFVSTQVLRLASNLVMTRLLAPDMFGIMSVVLVIQITLTLLCDFGLRIIVIQSPRGDDPRFLNTVWTLEVVRGLLIWSIGLAAAGGLAGAGSMGWLPPNTALAAPELPIVMAITLGAAAITGFQSTNLITAQRHMQFRTVALVEIGAQLTALAAMLAIGWFTRSIWALAAGSLVAAAMTTIMSHHLLPGLRNRFAWDPSAVRDVVVSGRWVVLSSLLLVASLNADRFIFSGFVGAAELGLYAIAMNIIVMIDSVGSRLFSTVVLASMSEAARNNPQSIGRSLSKHRVVFDAGYLAASGLMFASAPAIIGFLYDDRYAGAGPMLQVLSLSLIFARYHIFPAVYLAMGQPKLVATINAIKLLAFMLLFLTLYSVFGVNGAIWAVALHAAASTVAILWINRRFALNNFSLEFAVLPAWVVGWSIGFTAVEAYAIATGR